MQVFTCLNLGILLTLQQIKMGILHMNTFKRKIYSQLRLWKEKSGNRKSKNRIDFLQRRGNKVCQLEVKSSVTCLPLFMVPFLWCVVHCCSPQKTKLASSGIESSFGAWWNYFRWTMKLIYLRRAFLMDKHCQNASFKNY